jgi:RNA polymerase primary sigma factor
VEAISKLAREQRQMRRELGREPAPEDLAVEPDPTPEPEPPQGPGDA